MLRVELHTFRELFGTKYDISRKEGGKDNSIFAAERELDTRSLSLSFFSAHVLSSSFSLYLSLSFSISFGVIV